MKKIFKKILFAHHEVVDADTTKEETDKSHGNLILASKIAGCIFGSILLLNCYATIQTNCCVFCYSITTIGTIAVTGTGSYTTFQADSRIIIP